MGASTETLGTPFATPVSEYQPGSRLDGRLSSLRVSGSEAKVPSTVGDSQCKRPLSTERSCTSGWLETEPLGTPEPASESPSKPMPPTVGAAPEYDRAAGGVVIRGRAL